MNETKLLHLLQTIVSTQEKMSRIMERQTGWHKTEEEMNELMAESRYMIDSIIEEYRGKNPNTVPNRQ